MHQLIAHMDLDTFFVSVERLMDSRLRDRPILIGGTSNRGVVSSCSYETRVFGVHSGMPMKMAKQLCPEAIVVKGSSMNYSAYSHMVTEIIQEQVPAYEKTSIDEFYVDMTGMDKFFGAYQLLKEVKNKIKKDTGLPISFGLSSGKTVSKVATGEHKPEGQAHIQYGAEKSFLAPLTVQKLPGIGSQTFVSLRSLGIRYLRTLQETPVELLEQLFGKHGKSLWKKANGIDNSAITPYSECKSISTERTFEKDTIDVQKLKSIVLAMAESLAFQLRQGQKLTACITLKLRYSDFSTHTKQLRIPYTSCDHILIKKALELFDKLYQKRVLIRLVGLRFSHLVSGGHQINMLEDTEEVIRLYQAMDHIRRRFGERYIKRATSMHVKSLGGHGNPFDGRPPMLLANRRQ